VKRGSFVKVSISRSYPWEGIHSFRVECGGSLENYRGSEFFDKLLGNGRHEEIIYEGEEYVESTYEVVADVEYVEVDGVVYLSESWLND
jgi:hypothetical protein